MKPVSVDDSFFNENVLNSLKNNSYTLDEMKIIALNAIDEKPNAKKANIDKATKMVLNSKTKPQLLSGCYNFILSIEGLKII